MKEPVYFVGCGKSKLDQPALARELYTGQLFQKSLRLAEQMAEQNGGHVFILSAKHGLLDPEAVVAPYDVAISHLNPVQRRDWGIDVADTLAAYLNVDGDPGLAGREYAFLAGRLYIDALEFGLTEVLSYCPNIQTPMHGMGIGSRLQWLNERIAATA